MVVILFDLTALEYQEYVADIRKLTGDSEQDVKQWISNMGAETALELPLIEIRDFISIVGRYPSKSEIDLIRLVDIHSIYYLL